MMSDDQEFLSSFMCSFNKYLLSSVVSTGRNALVKPVNEALALIKRNFHWEDNILVQMQTYSNVLTYSVC